QLETIRTAIVATPSILTAFKGEMPIEQYLAEAEAALAAEAATEAARPHERTPRASRNLSGMAAYAAVLAVFAGVGWFIYQLFPAEPAPLLAEQAESAVAEDWTAADADRPEESTPAEPAEAGADDEQDNDAPRPDTVEPVRPRLDAAQFPILASREKNDEHYWNDWAITAAAQTTLERSEEWYRTDDANHRHGAILSVTGGPLTLTKQLNESAETRYLQIQVRPETALRAPGKLVVRLNDEIRGEFPIGKGTTRWPAYVELHDAADRAAMATIEFVPAGPDQRITWVRIEPMASQGIAPLPECLLARKLAAESNDSARQNAVRETRKRSDAYTEFVLLDVATGDEPSATARAEAMLVLIDRNDPAIRKELADYLHGVDNAAILIEAFKRLAHRPFPEFLPSLAKSIRQHEDVAVRRHAVLAVRGMEAESTTPLLMTAATTDADPQVQVEAMTILVSRNDQAVRHDLANYLQKRSSPETLHMSLGRIFNHPFEEFLPLLIHVLHQQEALHMRQQAVHGIRRFNSTEATQALLDAWKKNDPELRPLLVESLCRREHPALERLMINVLSGDDAVQLKIHAAQHFNARPSEAAIPVLRKTVESEHNRLKNVATAALKKAETVMVHQK
ncbi:MAG: HEAT repeat domain-containing protein, partial [Pirellulales bacterium]